MTDHLILFGPAALLAWLAYDLSSSAWYGWRHARPTLAGRVRELSRQALGVAFLCGAALGIAVGRLFLPF